MISSKCGKSFHCLHCSEFSWLKRNKYRLNRLAKKLCLKYTCRNYKRTNNLHRYLQVPFKQYYQFYLRKLRWIRYLCEKRAYLWNAFENKWESILYVLNVRIPYVLLRQTFKQRFLGQMTSFIVCKLSYLIWPRAFLSYGVSQINSSVAQACNCREFSTQQLNTSSGQDKAQEQRHYRRVLRVPELGAMRLLIFHSSKGSS